MTATTGVTVTGIGSASGVPDQVRLDLAAEATAASVDAAVRQGAAAAAAMRAALVERGVDPAQLRSSTVGVHPDYRHDRGPRGYTARFGLSALVREVDNSGAIAQAAISAGGDAARLDGLVFDHAHADALREAARDAAFADARRRAEQYAQLAGQALGVIEEITEAPATAGGPIVPIARFAAQEAAVSFDAGTQEVSVAVTVRWAWA